MSIFYTNVQVSGSKILYRGIQNGHRVKGKRDYFPTLFVNSPEPSKYTTIHGEYVQSVKPGNIRDAKDFIARYKDVSNYPIYGYDRFEYAYITDEFPEEIDWEMPALRVANIDIEVGSEAGFPQPDQALWPITAITVKTGKEFVVFSTAEFKNSRSDVRYVKSKDEIGLINDFMEFWTSDYPDIITGWNIKFFDIPYIVNRMTRLFGEAYSKRFSPWGQLHDREVNFGMGRKAKTYIVLGIAALDYQDMYQRYAPEGKSQPTYRLDAIANVELGTGKLSYEEYENLNRLWKENPQLFIEYNIRDVELVEQLDDKLKLIELVCTLAYDAKCNFEDAFAQVRMWDVLVFNRLREMNQVVPQNERHSKEEMYVGAYVKPVQVGLHRWVAGFDLDSLYPHLIMEYNISPEMLIEPYDYPDELRTWISQNTISVENVLHQKLDLTLLKKLDITMTPNGQFFRREKQGFMAEMMESMYVGRAEYKNKMKDAKKELETCDDPVRKTELIKLVARFNNLQLAKKVCLNSAYGAMGNEFFRYFDVRLAAGITTAGQVSIRWIEDALNAYLNKLLSTTAYDYIIASDTDSVYIVLDKLIQKAILDDKPDMETIKVIRLMDKFCNDKILVFIDKTFHELADYVNAYQQKMSMKREALCDKAIWTSKKHYILRVWNNEGLEYKEPKVKVMGLEMVKSTMPAPCKKKSWEAVDLILNKTEDDVINLIDAFRKEFREMDPADIATPKGCNGLETYKGQGTAIFGFKCPMHVRGALLYNHYIKEKSLESKYELIKEGEKIKYVALKEPNPIRSNTISFPMSLPKELDLHSYIDYDTQYDKNFLEPLKAILDVIGWKTKKINRLGSFFS